MGGAEQAAFHDVVSVKTQLPVPEQPPPDQPANTAPARLSFAANRPNPFHESTTLHFTLPARGQVDLVLFDLQGRRVRTLLPAQVREAGAYDLPFARALRSMLRHDPDIMMVGEVRDHDTAAIAIESALTGHLVLTTLHTNDAPGALSRLTEMGIEPFLTSSAVDCVLAQRLARRLCKECKEPYEPSEEQLMELELLPEDVMGRVFFRGRGCDPASDHIIFRFGIFLF